MISLPFSYTTMAFAIAIACMGSFKVGGMYVQSDWDAEKLAASEKTLKTKVQKELVSSKADAAHQSTQETVRTVFKDRIIYKDREVPREVIIRQDAACLIPHRFVSVWNSANRAELPDAASFLDESASGIVLSDVEAQKEREAELCVANTEQLKALQSWVREQQLIKE